MTEEQPVYEPVIKEQHAGEEEATEKMAFKQINYFLQYPVLLKCLLLSFVIYITNRNSFKYLPVNRAL